MKKHSIKPRFRINPFEKMTFTLAAFGFFASAYSFFLSDQTIHPSTLSELQPNPLSEGRQLASSAHSSLKTLEFQCFKPQDVSVHSKKVRITGHICNAWGSIGNPAQLVSSKVLNSTHPFEATVFAVTDSTEFSTDFIPLAAGENLIHIEFSFSDRPSFAADWKIIYTPELSQNTSH